MSRSVVAVLLACLAGLAAAADDPPAPKPAQRPDVPAGFVAADAPPRWVWADQARDRQTVFFRREVTVPANVRSVKLSGACDDAMTVYVDGKEVVTSKEGKQPLFQDVTDAFRAPMNRGARGRHVVAVRARNTGSSAGLLLRLVFEPRAGKPFALVTDDGWRVAEKAADDWKDARFDDRAWAKATVVGKLGDKPWEAITEKALTAAARRREPPATAPETLKVAKDFKVELLYSVPKDVEGSWVNLCVDPKGRLITSDQYGPLYRITPPPLGGKAEETKVEKIEAPIGEAQGLLWAFDSLYVVVNRGQKYQSGLYRVRASHGDDQLDEVKLLRKIDGGGEHGPHAVLLAPDGKSLYVVCGDGTRPVEVGSSRVPRIWGEDHLLPRMPDGRGFMRDVLAPGGCIYHVDPEGQQWELVSNGFRNQYDAAFNRQGELFTYDADMEWDFNTPWYRPTRVCHVTSGSEFGWRNGAGKWPPYYPDSLPAVLDIGPGSPTGISFGYGTKFPAKYQEALFICDWSYGKLYAVHLTPEGSSYKGQAEEFVSGRPLPLTDVVVNPKDGALYFTIGGRKTKSGLYRVTYAGQESTTPSKGDDRGAELRAVRHKLEAFHGHPDPAAVGVAWPYLGHADRFLRFAARVALEHQDLALWRDRALAEKDPAAALTALLALVRVSSRDPFHRRSTDPPPDLALKARLLEALGRIDWARLSEPQRADLVRVYEVLFNRMGRPDESARQHVIGRLNPHYPDHDRFVNAELCQVLVYLEAPHVVEKTLKLLAAALTQEEQLEYARALRVLKTGWTPAERKEYFSWFLKASHYRGGASFGGFLKNIKDDAVATLTEQEKAELKPLIDAPVESSTPVAAAPPRPFVKKWTVDELVPLVDRGLKQRNFDRGRALFAAANCFSCHRFANEGGAQGPDLTGAGGRFSVRDLLESVVEPSKVISDQYAAVTITTSDGKVVTGRIVNLNGDSISVMTNMLAPNDLTNLDRKKVDSMETSKVSLMPEGLLDSFHEDEILDLMAYLLSGGDRRNKMFAAAR